MPPSDPLYSLTGSTDVPSEVAGRNQAGSNCPICVTTIKVGAMIRVCPVCRTVHHGRCWEKYGRCGGYDCSAPRPGQVSPPVSGSVLVISSEELERATPLPPRQPSAIPRPIYRQRYSGPVVNRLAIVALLTAFAGIPFFGLLTGFMAIGMAIPALFQIRDRHDKGKGLAIAALTLGIIDIIGWIIFLGWALAGMDLRQIFRDRPGQPPPAKHGSILPDGPRGSVTVLIAREGLQQL